MESILKDIRYSARLLAKRPLFAVVSILTLALGIGATTAIFSVVHAVLLSPLPYEKSDELVVIAGKNGALNLEQQPASIPDFEDWRGQSQSFEEISATRNMTFNITEGAEPERVNGARVSVNLFALLKARPVLGRDFLEAEGQPGSEPVAILSYRLWQRYGADPDLVGRSLGVDGGRYTVVGVLAQGIAYPLPETDLYVPFIPQKNELARGARSIRVIGRLKSGRSLAEAGAELEAISARAAQEFPVTNANWGAQVTLLREQVVGRVRPTLIVLVGAVCCVLLIACTNVANLLLVRAAARRKEFAIRTALGSSRRRLIRQLLTESLLLSLIGGMCGLFLAGWGVEAIIGISASSIPRADEIGINGTVLCFTLILSIVTGLLFGILPAIRSSNRNFGEALKEGGKGSAGGVLNHRLLRLMVVAEVSLALVLLVAAGLLVRSFITINQVDPGFDQKQVLSMAVSLSQNKYPDVEKQSVFFEKALARVGSIPGVEAASAVHRIPIFRLPSWTSFTIKGRPVEAGNEPNADSIIVSPGYFKTMGIPFIRGRDISERDVKDSPEVIVINQALADKFFPGEDPVGKFIQVFPGGNRWREVVGVARNAKFVSLDAEINPAIYIPIPQNPYVNAMRGGFIVVRSGSDPKSLLAAIKSEIRQVDDQMPVAQVRTMDEVISESLAQRRLSMSLIVVLAALAAVLAAVGIYGVMAYSIAQRTHEIGIRMALGAQPSQVVRMVLSEGVRLTMVGIGTGLIAAFTLSRFMSSLLYGVTAFDPATYASIVVLLTGTALLACFIPARKAARVNPIEVLHYD